MCVCVCVCESVRVGVYTDKERLGVHALCGSGHLPQQVFSGGEEEQLGE